MYIKDKRNIECTTCGRPFRVSKLDKRNVFKCPHCGAKVKKDKLSRIKVT